MKDLGSREVFSDVRELLEYLRELGAEELAVDLSILENLELDAPSPGTQRDDVKHNHPPARIQTPESNPYVAPSATANKGEMVAGQSRKDLSSVLGSSRLSDIRSSSEDASSKIPPRDQKEIELAESSKESDPMVKVTRKKTVSSVGNIDDVRTEIGDCRRCGLCEERTQVVHSTGNVKARLMFVGEAPGADEDLKGEPFVGRAGQLLTKIIEAMGYTREEVFIGNINRCRPPGNRTPTTAEADVCRPFLLREIEIVQPEVIVVLGNTACQNLLDTKEGITKLRGSFRDYHGVKVMPTFHPAYLLRDPSKKKFVWDDMKQVKALLEGESGE